MVLQTAAHVSEHEFLSPDEVASLLRAIDDHREIALDRNPQQPGTFMTYGRAAYLDVCQARSDRERDYTSVVAESNRQLQDMLGDFYERLQARVADILGEPVAYAPETLALPGLHVFRGPGIRAASRGGVHFDVQYQKLRFPAPIDRTAPPISVTLPLRNPVNGTGLQVYNVTFPDYERAYRMGRINSLEELVERKTSAYHPYHPGHLQLHHRLVVHSLTSPGPIEPEDERITLQGHGVRCNGTWILYW